MAIITLTSDFGLLDVKVPIIKGRVASIDENVKIIDITHNIEAYNISQAAYMVRHSYRHFPEGSVHIIAVDSYFRKEVKSIIYKVDKHYFIAVDNGILSLVFPDTRPEEIYEITYNHKFDDKIVFPTADIFVPVAVYLCNGGNPNIIGKPYQTPMVLSSLQPQYNHSEKIIVGEIIHIDNFGNSVCNISREFFEKYSIHNESFRIRFRSIKINKIYNYHTELVKDWDEQSDFYGREYAVFNEFNLLEICIYKSDKRLGASSLFGLSVGEKVYIEFF